MKTNIYFECWECGEKIDFTKIQDNKNIKLLAEAHFKVVHDTELTEHELIDIN